MPNYVDDNDDDNKS